MQDCFRFNFLAGRLGMLAIEAEGPSAHALQESLQSGGLSSANTLVLLDCSETRADMLSSALEDMSHWSLPPIVALCNCPTDHPIENLISWPGVRALFHASCREEAMATGLEAVLHGHYWIPRHLLVKHLEQTRRRPVVRRSMRSDLTPRESEILELLTTGATNQDIAAQLAVSCHTVKTHVYNLFKKVGVGNRVQLVNWARAHHYGRHLPQMMD